MERTLVVYYSVFGSTKTVAKIIADTVNIALQSWLFQVDLSGKRVIPFCTNDGDGNSGICKSKMKKLVGQ